MANASNLGQGCPSHARANARSIGIPANASPLLKATTEEKREAVKTVAFAQQAGYSITMTGHSLGGGLATAAALHTNQKAVTFNAAGVNSWTTNISNAANLITNYRVRGEILSALQDLPIFGTPMPSSSAGDTF